MDEMKAAVAELAAAMVEARRVWPDGLVLPSVCGGLYYVETLHGDWLGNVERRRGRWVTYSRHEIIAGRR